MVIATPSPIGLFPVESTTISTSSSIQQQQQQHMNTVDSSLRSRTTSNLPNPPAARRKTAAKSSSLCRSNSLSRDIGHAATETYLITRLAFTLLRYLGYNSIRFLALSF